MAEVTYPGPHDEVVFVDPESGEEHVVERNGSVDVEPDTAKNLREQGWLGPSDAGATSNAQAKAVELDVDLSEVSGSGKDGKVTVADVEAYAAARDEAAEAEVEAGAAGEESDDTGGEG